MVLEWIVVILPALFAVFIEILSKGVREHRYYRIAVGVFGFGLSALTWFQISRAHRIAGADRESAVIETSRRVSAEVSASVSESVTKSLSAQYAQTINTLQGQIGTLESQLAAQGKKVDIIQRSNIVTGKTPVRVEIANPTVLSANESPLNVHVSEMPVQPNLQYGKNARRFILTTNRVMNGGRAQITCKNKISQGSASLAGVGGFMGGGRLLNENTYLAEIETPNWTPDFPLVITLYFDESDLGPCMVTLP